MYSRDVTCPAIRRPNRSGLPVIKCNLGDCLFTPRDSWKPCNEAPQWAPSAKIINTVYGPAHKFPPRSEVWPPREECLYPLPTIYTRLVCCCCKRRCLEVEVCTYARLIDDATRLARYFRGDDAYTNMRLIAEGYRFTKMPGSLRAPLSREF